MDNFIVEEYVIYAINNEKNIRYVLKKYDSERISITRYLVNIKEEITLNDIHNEYERGLIEEYIRKLKCAKLKYATNYIYSLLSRKYTITLKEYGDSVQIKNYIQNNTNYKIVRYYFNAKGKLFKKMFKTN